MKKYPKVILKWITRLILALVLLMVLLALLLQLSAVQTRVTQRLIREVSSRTGAELTLERISIRLPSGIALRGLYAEDALGDTLLYAGRVQVDMRPLALINKRIKVGRVALEDISASITRLEPDTVFSYDFILQALARNGTSGIIPEVEEEKSPSAWVFELGKLEISKARVRFADHFSGIDLQTDIGLLATRIEQFDPQAFQYHLGETRIGETRISLSMTQPSRPPEDKDTEPAVMDLALKALGMDRFDFSMDTWEGLALLTRIDALDLLPRKLDISQQDIDLERFTIDGLLVDMVLPAPHAEEPQAGESQAPGKGFRWADTFAWRLVADALEVRRAEVAMATRGTPPQQEVFDPKNFRFSGMELLVSGLDVSPGGIELELENLRAVSGRDFSLSQLTAGISLGNSLRLDGLRLVTALSRLEGDLFAGFSPLVFPLENIEDVPVEVDLREGRLGSDLAWFIPQLMGKLEPADRLLFGISASGTMNELGLDTLWAEGPGSFRLETAGRVANLMHPEALEADVPSLWLSARLDKLRRFFPPGIFPEQLALPDSLVLLASLKGTMKEMQAKADVQSSFGDLWLQGAFGDLSSKAPAYNVTLEVRGFDPGTLLMQEELLGPVFARLELEGQGLDPQTLDAAATLRVSEVLVKGYTYHDLSLDATLREGLADARLEYLDEHLGLEAVNQVSLARDVPSIKALWDISHMNLQALNFMEDETILRGKMEADLDLTRDDFAEGHLKVSQLQVRNAKDLFSLDLLEVTTAYADSLYSITIASPLLEGFFEGRVSPLEVPGILGGHLASMMGSVPDSVVAALGEGFFDFRLEVLPSPWYSEFFLPQLSFVDPFRVEGHFDGAQGALDLDAGIPKLEYGNLIFNDLLLSAETRAGVGQLKLGLPLLEGEGFQIRKLGAEGQLSDSVLTFGLAFDDREDVRWLDLKGRLWQDSQGLVLSLGEEVLINREPWQLNPGNRIVLGDSLLLADRFRLQKGEQYLLLQSRAMENGFPPLDIRFSSLDLGQFFALDSLPLAGGIINGDISLHSLFDGFSFVSDLNIEGFAFRGDTLGDIHILGSNPSEDLYALEAVVRGYGNEIEAGGTYQSGEAAAIDVSLSLREVNLSTLEGFTAGQLSHLEGNLRGSLTARGSPSKPVLKGSLQLEDVGFRAEMINAPYRIPEGQIVLEQNTLRLDSFSMEDSLGRSATLAGTVDVSDLKNPGFGLTLRSQNFLLMNVPEGRNELFWGRMFIDSDLSLRGDLNSTRIEGRLKLNEGSTLSLTVPQGEPQAIGDEGVVEFISTRDTLFLGMVDRPDPGSVMSPFRNLNVSVNAEIDPQTDVKVIIDEYAGDFLEIKGGGLISYGIDPGGRVSIAGRYEITDGTYLLTFYDVISRRFQIGQGSSIVLTGDPLKARVDITAIYNLRTSARELFESAITGAETDPALRQQFPFEVSLSMKGELLNPRISFAISLPASQQNALDGRLQARLRQLSQNESELNKQVFALLVLGQFVQHNPLASVGGGTEGLSTAARSSASRFLSQQLNRLSDQYIQGIDLNFDLESYEDFSGDEVSGRTELQLEVSKNFLDERLRLQVGGNIELEDETRRQTSAGEIAGDFLLEYLLNPQGSLILRGFRKKDFGNLFDGEVVNTGISLLFRKNYNRFRELFMKKEKDAVVPEPDELEKMPEDEK